MLEKAQHVINSPEEAIGYLSEANNRLCRSPYREMNCKVLCDEKFLVWPASTKKHQAYDGGLVVHTAQVCQTSLAMLEKIHGTRPDLVYTAVLWHDRAKVRDYEKLPSGEWQNTDFHETERHLARSYAEFMHEAWSVGAPQEEVERIAHIMLAHHGRREWGSPVEPATAEAWAVHAADMMSGRYLQ